MGQKWPYSNPDSPRVAAKKLAWTDSRMTSSRENGYDKLDRSFHPAPILASVVLPNPHLSARFFPRGSMWVCTTCLGPSFPLPHSFRLSISLLSPALYGSSSGAGQVTLCVNTKPAVATDHGCTGHRSRSATIELGVNAIRRYPTDRRKAGHPDPYHRPAI